MITTLSNRLLSYHYITTGSAKIQERHQKEGKQSELPNERGQCTGVLYGQTGRWQSVRHK